MSHLQLLKPLNGYIWYKSTCTNIHSQVCIHRQNTKAAQNQYNYLTPDQKLVNKRSPYYATVP